MRALVVLAALVVVAVPGASLAARAPGKARLTITVWPQGRGAGKPATTSTLTCHPAGGTHPAPARACRRLFAHLGALRPVPRGSLCTERLGGPQVALIRGRIRGKRVRSLLDRSNGCELRRWEALGIVLAASRPKQSGDAARLEISVSTSPDGPERTATLTCDPAGGTLPSPAEACRRLAAIDDPFAPVPAGTACTLVWGGPQQATVSGSFRGKSVAAHFDRSNGCEIARWDRVAFLFAIG
jgi:hypothetical protein